MWARVLDFQRKYLFPWLHCRPKTTGQDVSGIGDIEQTAVSKTSDTKEIVFSLLLMYISEQFASLFETLVVFAGKLLSAQTFIHNTILFRSLVWPLDLSCSIEMSVHTSQPQSSSTSRSIQNSNKSKGKKNELDSCTENPFPTIRTKSAHLSVKLWCPF